MTKGQKVDKAYQDYQDKENELIELYDDHLITDSQYKRMAKYATNKLHKELENLGE